MEIDFDEDTETGGAPQPGLRLASGESAPYNSDDSPALVQKGTLDGRAVGADASSALTLGASPSSLVVRTSWNWVLRDGPVSKPLRLKGMKDDVGGLRGRVAVKVSRVTSVPPHDPAREIRVLARLSNPNVARLLNAYKILDPLSFNAFMPYYPLAFRSLLSSLSFASSPSFHSIVRSFTYQAFSALHYLHDALDHPIAHRDINSSNLTVDSDGSLVLVDFSVAIAVGGSPEDSEPANDLHCEVGTGAYRAPELLFGGRSYNPLAADRWSLGATLAELYTPFKKSADGSGTKGKLCRSSLFDGSTSDIALVADIFKFTGTPTKESWPEAASLPDFGKIEFDYFSAVDLASLLEPSQKTAKEVILDDGKRTALFGPLSQFVDLLNNLLQLSAGSRITTEKALNTHPFLQSNQPQEEVPLILPASHKPQDGGKAWKDLLSPWLTPAIEQQML